MTRTSRRRVRSAGIAAGAVAIVAAIGGGAALWRRRGGGAPDAARGASAENSPSPAAGTSDGDWECACGQRFRVAGVERHRVYWTEGAPESDPVMAGHCPSCDRALPA